MKSIQDWVDDYEAGRAIPRRLYDLSKSERGKLTLKSGEFNESAAATKIILELGRKYPGLRYEEALAILRREIEPPNVTLPDESVTPDEPRHVKPLLPDMRTANICECCGKAFETARRHAATCSAKCRKAKSRGTCK